MFNKQMALFIFSWFLGALGCYYLLTPSHASKAAYQKLIKNSFSDKAEAAEIGPIEQMRSKVTKQILYTKNSDRMESRLTGGSSHLIYTKQKGELVERLTDVTCAIQDEINNESNLYPARTFKAKEALYSYQTGQLKANDVEVAHYAISEKKNIHDLDLSTPIFKGKAEALDLTLLKEPQVNAKGFQGIFHLGGFE